MCLKIGVPHPDYLDGILTASQWQDWLNFDSIRMIGNEQYRHELRHGQRMAQFVNYNRDTDKCPDGFPPIDFMNFVERAAVQEATPEECQARIDREIFGV